MKQLFASLLAAAAILGGCSSAKTAAGREPADPPAGVKHRLAAVNPCTFATRAQASAALGVPAKPGAYRNYLDGFCHFDGPTVGYEVYIQMMSADMAASYAEVPDGVPISGIGDQATWMDGALYVRSHGRGAEINFELPHKPIRMTGGMEAFAKAVAAHM